MASSATDSQGKDKNIREQLIDTGAVDVMMSVGNNFFYTKSLPCTLWFFDKAKREENKDKVLFIDARNYYTVVDKTLNEWSEWQMKNLNAIVWLYRGEDDKYLALLREYISTISNSINELEPKAEPLSKMLDRDTNTHFLGNIPKIYSSLDVEEAKEKLVWQIEITKKAIAICKEKANVKGKKMIDVAAETFIAEINEILTVIKEYEWLTEKFGEGEYKDVLGLCYVASSKKEKNGKIVNEFKEKGFSLTPGAYVGVEEVADDGVDFSARMKEIHEELLELQAQSNALMNTISENIKELGL